jgi:hypothetical protein
MSFEHEGSAFNLLETPGSGISANWDFSEAPTGSASALLNYAVPIIAWYFHAYRRPRSGGQFVLEELGRWRGLG